MQPSSAVLAHKARTQMLAAWLHQQLVLTKEVAAVEEETLKALCQFAGSIAAEREAAARELRVHRREVMNSIGIVKSSRAKLLERALETNEETLAKLRQVEEALSDAPTTAMSLITRAAESEADLRKGARMSMSAGEARVTSRTRAVSSGPVKKMSTSSASKPHVLPTFQRDVEALEHFLAVNGGSSLGWSNDDHQEFLRAIAAMQAQAVSAAHATEPTFHPRTLHPALSVLSESTPTEFAVSLSEQLNVAKSLSDVVQHVALYRQYLTLVEAKRLALEAWRDAKRTEQLHSERLAEIQRQRVIDAEAAEAKLKEERRLARLRDTAHQVRQWREDRARSAQDAAIAETAFRQQKVADTELQRRLRAARTAAEVDAHRVALGRAREVQLLTRCVALEENKQAANVSLKHRQAQAAEFAERRKAMFAAARRPSSAESTPRPRSSSSAAQRDPSRLTSATASSAARSSSADTRVEMTRGVSYLTPRNNHFTRSPANWCGFQYMR